MQVLGLIGSGANGVLDQQSSLLAATTCTPEPVMSEKGCYNVMQPVAGAAMPIFALVIGRMVNTLGKWGDSRHAVWPAQRDDALLPVPGHSLLPGLLPGDRNVDADRCDTNHTAMLVHQS